MIDGEPDGNKSDTFHALPIVIGSTCLFCALFQVFLTRGSVEKGKAPSVGWHEDQAAYVFMSKNCSDKHIRKLRFTKSRLADVLCKC